MRWFLILGSLVAAQPAFADPAATALEAGRLDEADALYMRALAASPADAGLWMNMCIVRYAQGDFGRAINACYRGLPANQGRAIGLLHHIELAIRAQHLEPPQLLVPDPAQSWFVRQRPDSPLSAGEPPAAARATRTAAVEPQPSISTFDVLPDDAVTKLRGRAPTLPYSIAPRNDDYRRGYDVSLRTGLLNYAPAASPFVAGARLEMREREPGVSSHIFYYGEYLHAYDNSGGIAAGGIGARDTVMSGAIGLAIPWGIAPGRDHATYPGHVTGLHAELRYGIHREFMIGRDFGADFEATLVGGLNLAKAAIRIGDGFSDVCFDNHEENCPHTPDGNPDWPMWHAMLQVGVSFGYRTGRPAYDHAELFTPFPMGGS
jgi:hypothetical protein